MDSDGEQEPCCVFALTEQCPCLHCGGCFNECHGDHQVRTLEPPAPVAEGDVAGEPLVRQGDASVGSLLSLDEVSPSPSPSEAALMESVFVLTPENWVVEMSESEQRVVMTGQAGASMMLRVMNVRGEMMDVFRDRYDHPRVDNSRRIELLQGPGGLCDEIFAELFIVGVVSLAHMEEIRTVPMEQLDVGLACSSHGPCCHIADGCFRGPRSLPLFRPHPEFWGIPGLSRHLDLGSRDSIVFRVFNWGLYPNLHRDSFMRAVRMVGDVYRILTPASGEAGGNEDEHQRWLWCQAQLQVLRRMVDDYCPGEQRHYQRQVQALHGHLCPSCPHTDPHDQYDLELWNAFRQAMRNRREERVRAVVGDQLAAELLFLEPAAARAAAALGAVAPAEEEPVPPPAEAGHVEQREEEDHAEGERVSALDPSRLQGADTPDANPHAALAVAEDGYVAMCNNVWGVCLIFEHFLLVSSLPAGIIGWPCPGGWQMIYVR